MNMDSDSNHLVRPWETKAEFEDAIQIVQRNPVIKTRMTRESPELTRVEVVAIQEALLAYGTTHSVFSEEFLQALDIKIEALGND